MSETPTRCTFSFCVQPRAPRHHYWCAYHTYVFFQSSEYSRSVYYAGEGPRARVALDDWYRRLEAEFRNATTSSPTEVLGG